MNFGFDRIISRPVLENYLSRAISMARLTVSPQRDEDLRMLANIGAKFVGRAAMIWADQDDEEVHFAAAAKMVADYQRYDADTVFQACVFEVVCEPLVAKVSIPAWVFAEFGLPVETRTFRYEAMLYDSSAASQEPVKWRPHAGNQWMRDYFGKGNSVPDMSRPETQMWFFYRAKRYIDAGYEALHMGQIHLMNNNDPGNKHWWSVIQRIRAYAETHARRHKILIDAHTHGVAIDDGRLLFDFHSYPQHITDDVAHPQHGTLELNFRHSIFGKSLGGVSPNGWRCEHLPFIVEFDNWGRSGKPGQHLGTPNWVWGYDEICWFAHQPEDYRNEYLRYASARVRELDANGHLQMPGRRGLGEPVDGVKTYHANTRSTASPNGFNQEETIKELWAEESGR
ncbi:hypothetical protein BH10PLA1_BH10PLA1_17490 [soil metagenome]